MNLAHDLSLTQVNNYLASYIECPYVKMKNLEMNNSLSFPGSVFFFRIHWVWFLCA